MRRLALLALVAAPLALSASHSSAACTVAPVGKTTVTVCNEPTYTCAGADTPSADAAACLTRDGMACYVDLPNRPLLACA